MVYKSWTGKKCYVEMKLLYNQVLRIIRIAVKYDVKMGVYMYDVSNQKQQNYVLYTHKLSLCTMTIF